MGSSLGGAQPYVRDGVGYIPLRATGRRSYVHEDEGQVVAWAMVDEADFRDVAQFRWHLTDTGYAHRWYGGRPPRRVGERMHRRLLGLGKGDKRQCDHINRDKLDNRRANLRIVSGDAHNAQNVPSYAGGTSNHRGVSFDRQRGKWAAQMKCGDLKLSKRFATEKEAAAQVRAWRKEHMPYAVD